MIGPAYYSLPHWFGSALLILWQRLNKQPCERLVYAVVAGPIAGPIAVPIAGQGRSGNANAVLAYLGIPG